MITTNTTSYTYTHTVTYMTGKLLLALKQIIANSGLSPAKLTDDWETYERGIKSWLASGHLERVTLEVFKPGGSSLIGRWDLPVEYATNSDGFWFDPDDIAYQVRKAGQWPSQCDYNIILSNKPGRPDVHGWFPTTYLSTDGLQQQSIGTIINANGMRAAATYWRTS